MKPLVMFGLLFLFLYLGMPIAFALGLTTLTVYALFLDQPLMTLAAKLYHGLNSFPLVAVPFFILAGDLMSSGGVAQRIINFANAQVGHFRGGLAQTAVLACAFFAAISGSSPATVVAIGSIMIPGMYAAGYDRNYAVGSVVTAGTLGILIPPSITMIIYALATGESVGKLYIAGIVPGLVLTGLFMGATYFVARRKGYRAGAPPSWATRRRVFREGIWSLLMPVIILVGIYGLPETNLGLIRIPPNAAFTPTEAAAVAALYGLLVGKFIHREMTWKQVYATVLKSAASTAMLMFIVANAMLFGFLATNEQIHRRVSDLILGMDLSPWMFLLVLNLILILAGDFFDPATIILVLVPVFFPAAVKLGINPIHLGIIVTVNMEIGMITPPVGLNLYVATPIAHMSLYGVLRAALPWIVVLLLGLVLVTYWPGLSLWLPRLLYGSV